MRVRVTIEYDYEDPDAFAVEDEISHWRTGSIDVPTLDDGTGSNCTVTCIDITDEGKAPDFDVDENGNRVD